MADVVDEEAGGARAASTQSQRGSIDRVIRTVRTYSLAVNKRPEPVETARPRRGTLCRASRSIPRRASSAAASFRLVQS